jgi:alcohol dehydrogenase class IV
MAQKIVHGIDEIVDQIKNQKFLLVRDRAYNYLEIKALFDSIPHVEFSEFTPNPLYEQVCEGVKIFNDNECNMIVAVGGGSTIDVAKCIKLYCRMDSSINYLKQEKKDTGIPLIAIPTTAGTGSESTKHAVIYYEGKKQSISHPSIVPDIAILEPSSLKTLPVYQKKCTMLDALCQGIESWWSVNSNDESIGYSKKAVQMIIDNWKAYIFDNTDEAAVKIMEAANYAGRAINITATTAAHAMSYKITSMYNLPHGHAVAVCMPEVWGYMLDHTDDCIDSRGADYLRNTLSDISEMFSLDSFKQLMTDLAMEYPVSTNKDADVNLLTESVNPVRLKNNPVALESKVLHEMYERIVR